MAAAHKHKILELQCFIESANQKAVKIKLSQDDWHKNLNVILTRIPKKFKCISNLKDEEWIMMINKQALDKSNAAAFGAMIASIPPPAVVEIIKTRPKKKQLEFKVEFKGKSVVWIPPNTSSTEEKDWNDNLSDLRNTISSTFASLNGADYEIQDELECDVEGSELLELYTDASSPQIVLKIIYDVPQPKESEAEKPLPKTLNIIYGNSNVWWSAPKPESKDDDEWETFYKDMMVQIESKLGLKAGDIKELMDPSDCEVGGGDELKILYDELMQDDKAQSYDVKIMKKEKEKDINAETEALLKGMDPHEINTLKKAISDGDKGEEPKKEEEAPKEKEKEEEAPKETEKRGNDDAKANDDGKEEKKGDDDDAKGGGDSADNTSSEPQNVKVVDEIVSVDDLLNDLDLDSPDMAGKLTELGSSIGLLGGEQKLSSYNAIKGIMEGAERGKGSATQGFQDLLRTVLAKEGLQYAKCALQFVKLIGYGIRNESDGVVLDGKPNEKILGAIKSSFHHLSNAMQKPMENIYQQLKISVPKTAAATFHKSGILDNQFITFQLPQIVLENQQSSLVNKNILDPGDFERFVNFLVPNSSKYLCKEIYFDKLRKMEVQSIGLFGSRREVLDMLTKYNAISTPLKDVLKSDNDNRYLQPGIHAILPVDLQKSGNFNKWDGIVYIFYWSLPNSFDMVKMKAVKYMRKDPSCLLTRVLYEISSTVCIEVSSAELTDFGITYELNEEGIEEKEKPDEAVTTGKKRKKRRKKRAGRRQKLNFAVEETKENMVMCNDVPTKEEQLKTKTIRKDESWKHFKVGDQLGALDSGNKWYMSEVMRVKTKDEQLSEYGDNLKLWQRNQLWKFNSMEGVYIHYIGWGTKWNEWVFIDNDTLCNCISDSCTSWQHKLKSKEKQEGKAKSFKSKNKWAKDGNNWVTNTFNKVGNWMAGVGDVGTGGVQVATGGLDDADADADANATGEGDKDDEAKDDEEYDIACDTFILDGVTMSGYCQLFKQKERPDENTIDKTCWNPKEVEDFLVELNTKYILEWQKSFVTKSVGLVWLAHAICKDEYDTYIKDKEGLDKEEQGGMSMDKIKERVDEILGRRHEEILWEFHDNYVSWKYCKKEHQELLKILNALLDDGKLRNDLSEAAFFATVEPKETSLPKQSYSWFRDTCLKNMERETGRVLRIYRNKKNKGVRQKNLCIEHWLKAYKEQLENYKNNVYGGGRYKSSVLHRESIRDEIEKEIHKEYNKKRRLLKSGLETTITAMQSSKPAELQTTTLTTFAHKKKSYMNTSEKFTVTYTVPTVVPPSYYMQFVSIDLPNTSEDIRINNMKNMKFEMPQSDTLIFHQMMGNGDTIMFIREDDDDTKTSQTKIIASHSRVLAMNQPALKTLKNKKVNMVAYCEAQKLFAILMDDVLGFCIFQDGGRISITNKRCELRDIAWWDKSIKFRTLLVEEIQKNIWVWLIDESNIVRAFDYDAGSWDSAKQFELDQSYDHFQLSPKGSFLMALKHQYKEDLEEYEEKQKQTEEEQKHKDDEAAVAVNPTDEAKPSDEATKPSTDPNAAAAVAVAKPVDPNVDPNAAKAADSTAKDAAVAAAAATAAATAAAAAASAAAAIAATETAREQILNDQSTLELIDQQPIVANKVQHVVRMRFRDQNKKEWSLVAFISKPSTELIGMAVDKFPTDIKALADPDPVAAAAAAAVAVTAGADPNAVVDPNAPKQAVNTGNALDVLPPTAVKMRVSEWSSLHSKIATFSSLSSVKLPNPLPSDADPNKDKDKQKQEEKKENKPKKPTGKIEVHTYLLLEKKKLEYVVHSGSKTGYEVGDEKEFKGSDDNKDSFRLVDNILLPETFSTIDDFVTISRVHIKESNKKGDMLLCTISRDAKLLYHPLTIQVSEARMRINEAKKKQTLRRITKLDYMEYMIEKFGSRAAIYCPEDGKLELHTTFIMKEQSSPNQNAHNLCSQISAKIKKSLEDKEKKNFKWLTWDCNVLQNEDQLSASSVLRAVKHQRRSVHGDEWIKNIIMQIPIQIARGSNNKFKLMYNGEDDQDKYVRATDAYALCKAIRFGAYDGLIKSWEHDIKVVTSMGKQSTGKSYMLNHLFGTKFDISGGRCTDGGWLSVKIIDDILYIVCDFEGLGSFERSPQEDMLLATFNSAISNCTIFKCDNRFDRTVEDMFNKFQSGVKIMSGSQNCFTGELLLIIKDVVDTGADAAVADFKRHIERLAQEAELILNDKGKKQSSFFVSQMYQAGLEIIPFPPLANEAFFDELNDTLELAIDDIEIVHVGGKIFLDHIKLVMAKLHIGDFSAMSGEQAKIRSQEIRDNLKNAVEAGAITQPLSTQYGVTFQVDDDQNLLLLDGNQIIVVSTEDIKAKIKNYDATIADYVMIDPNIDQTLLSMLDSIADAGLILGKVESIGFLWEQFSFKITRNHHNFQKLTSIYQLFLDLIYFRRKLRVQKFIVNNTKKFEDQEKHEIESLTQAADSRLNIIREKMRLCKQNCNECFYPCLLCKNHEDDNNWADDHSCNQTGGTHSCQELCSYCLDKNHKQVPCADKCGHSGKHNCRSGDHTCGLPCSLSKYGGCQTKCNLESSHDKTKEPCKCAAETHYCTEKCGIAICKNSCKIPYTQKHDQHICIQQSCPYKCQVKCWNDSLKAVTDCGRPCMSEQHDHQIKMDSGECKEQGHTCDQVHPCPEKCTEAGNCKVEIQRKIVEKETIVTGAGSKIEYDSYAEVNAEKKRCCQKIPKGAFKHAGSDHKCYSGDLTDNIHTCEEKCDQCGYFCQEAYNHYQAKGSFHDCVHGNMRNTVFYATEEILDTGDNRKYKVGDVGVAEMCNIFCERVGRGHIHLELCAYEGKQCVEEEGRRHQSKEYMPNPKKPKDEVKHSKFWRRKKWKDPCVEKFRKIFDKCNFQCQHQVHTDRAANGEEDEVKWCVESLWHKPMQTPTSHTFNCKHPFSDCHVIFLCDISGSMDSTDGGTSMAQFTFIKNSPRLNNRLGALYSAIHNFLDVRLQKGCVDCVSAIMFNGHCQVAARQENADKDFVTNFLLKYTPSGGTNFGVAFNGAKDLIDDTQDSVVIFLTDGEASDNGSSNIVSTLAGKLGKKFQLFCILLGKISERGNPVIEGIANAGGGTLLSALSGNELGTTFTTIAKQMNAGAFGKL